MCSQLIRTDNSLYALFFFSPQHGCPITFFWTFRFVSNETQQRDWSCVQISSFASGLMLSVVRQCEILQLHSHFNAISDSSIAVLLQCVQQIVLSPHIVIWRCCCDCWVCLFKMDRKKSGRKYGVTLVWLFFLGRVSSVKEAEVYFLLCEHTSFTATTPNPILANDMKFSCFALVLVPIIISWQIIWSFSFFFFSFCIPLYSELLGCSHNMTGSFEILWISLSFLSAN